MTPPPIITACIGVGANLGDRAGNIRLAIDKLGATQGVDIGRVSSVLENAAVGGPRGSPPFLNAVIEVQTELAADVLLHRLLDIEAEMGRQRRLRWEPRVIDLDLLFYGQAIIDRAGVTIPHPRLHDRRFVLAPLAEIAPDWVHPLLGKSVRRLLDELPPVPYS